MGIFKCLEQPVDIISDSKDVCFVTEAWKMGWRRKLVVFPDLQKLQATCLCFVYGQFTVVMNVKFTHGFILDRNLNILLLSYPGRDRSVTAAEVSNTYQFITLSLRLKPAVTWSDRYTFRNAWLVTSTL